MTEVPTPADPASDHRAEKLHAIAAIFGEAMAARIAAGSGIGKGRPADPDRLAWQTNRLIRHVRDRVDPGPSVPARTDRPERSGLRTDHPPRVARLPVLVAGEDLAAEHPAVIAHLLKGEPQAIRVSVLRALPGHVSRAVIRRLRPAEPPPEA